VSEEVSTRQATEHVTLVEFSRPPHNYFDGALIGAIADAYEQLERGGSCRAIVLCSEGKHFCAGADLAGRSRQPNPVVSGVNSLYQQATRLFDAKTPVVAAVQGAAIGGGLGLACSADFRVASPLARFAANFARLGFHQGFGLTVTLPGIIGQQKALELLYTGRRIGGEEAAAIGLADRLAEPDQLRAAAHELAADIAASGPLAVRSIRETMRGDLAGRVRAATDHEGAEQDRLRKTADYAEGVRASSERRTPRFEGR
jgi:2-(1,2-epoxy-1,2-dihydrophenyl)acetyl-CoA isomerase